jgi:hypothetical protein
MNCENKNSGFLNNAGLLTLIAAAFAVTMGVVGIVSYQSYLDYYGYYGYDTSNAIGFLLLAGFGFVSSAFGFVGAAFSFMRKRVKITLLGAVLLLASGIFTVIAEWYYKLGYSDGIMGSTVPIIVLSLASIFLLLKSRKTYFDNTPIATTPETSSVEESIFKD